jgi:proline racemase
MVKAATLEQHPVVHPENDLMTGPTITCITGAAHDAHEGASSGRNATVISTGAFDWDDRTTWTAALDRSACGTATCARMATLHARGRLGLGEDYVHESILGTTFTGRLLEETSVAGRPAVVPQISGQAWITGIAQYVVDPTDPFPQGFTVGDIWGGMSDD